MGMIVVANLITPAMGTSVIQSQLMSVPQGNITVPRTPNALIKTGDLSANAIKDTKVMEKHAPPLILVQTQTALRIRPHVTTENARVNLDLVAMALVYSVVTTSTSVLTVSQF